jgi:meiotic recombination protein REC8
MATDIYQLPGDQMDVNLPIFGDDLPEGDAFPTGRQDQGSDQMEVMQSSSATSAPMRKKRTPRVLPIDKRMELLNKDLADWNANYLRNMDTVIKNKKQTRIVQQAKKDADYFVWGRGIGGISQHYAGVTGPNPFEMFIGDNLFELATGVSRKKVAGKKHDRDSGIDDVTQEDARRVRQKTGESASELGRGQDDEGFFMPGGDEVEMPREAPSALDDQQIFSSMPWNTGSKRGSSAIPRSGRPAVTDQGRPGSRPGSRMVSASPLHGRGSPLGLDVLRSLESDGDYTLGGDDFAMPGPSSPPTVIGTAQKLPTRVNEALDAEGANFLDFVTDALVEKQNHASAVTGALIADTITFEELLPPVENNKLIACQGLMMVLSLGTKGMLDVQQSEGFGDIVFKLTQQAKASQVVEISDVEMSGDEDSSDGGLEIVEERAMEEGEEDDEHFEEQFAAGRVAPTGDEHDELYDD